MLLMGLYEMSNESRLWISLYMQKLSIRKAPLRMGLERSMYRSVVEASLYFLEI